MDLTVNVVDWTAVAVAAVGVLGTLLGGGLAWLAQSSARKRERREKIEDATRAKTLEELGEAVHTLGVYARAVEVSLAPGITQADVEATLGVSLADAQRDLLDAGGRLLHLPTVARNILVGASKVLAESSRGKLDGVALRDKVLTALYDSSNVLNTLAIRIRQRLAPLPDELELSEIATAVSHEYFGTA